MAPTLVRPHPLTRWQEEMLRMLAQTGDLHVAAATMGVSYAAARRRVHRVRVAAGVPEGDDVVEAAIARWPDVFADITVVPQPSTLTRQQLRVVRLIAQGNTLPKVAKLMGVSYDTAKRHLTNAFKKVGAISQENLITRVYARWPQVFDGIVPPTPSEPLTLFQCRLLACFASGQRAPAAAKTLGLAEHTVKYDLKVTRRKLGAATTAQAVYSANALGFIRPRSVIR